MMEKAKEKGRWEMEKTVSLDSWVQLRLKKLNLQNQAVGLNTPVNAYVGKHTFSDGATSFLNPSPVQWWDKQV